MLNVTKTFAATCPVAALAGKTIQGYLCNADGKANDTNPTHAAMWITPLQKQVIKLDQDKGIQAQAEVLLAKQAKLAAIGYNEYLTAIAGLEYEPTSGSGEQFKKMRALRVAAEEAVTKYPEAHAYHVTGVLA